MYPSRAHSGGRGVSQMPVIDAFGICHFLGEEFCEIDASMDTFAHTFRKTRLHDETH
jgi:hypothetical protein